MPKLSDVGLGGVIPAIAANAGDNAGFALGILPGLAYQDYKRKKDASGAENSSNPGMKKGGKVKSASARADGCAQRGKTRGKIV